MTFAWAAASERESETDAVDQAAVSEPEAETEHAADPAPELDEVHEAVAAPTGATTTPSSAHMSDEEVMELYRRLEKRILARLG